MRSPSPRLLLVLFLAILLGAAGWCWLGQPPSNQELLANYAKAEDFLNGAKTVGDLPWWTPNFLQGTSLATAWSFMVTNVVMLAFCLPLGFLAGSKIAMLFCVLIGAVGVYEFLSRYTSDRWCGLIGAMVFCLSPALWVRVVGYEHFVVVCSLAFLPYAFLGLLTFIRRPSIFSAAAAAAGYAAVMLAYGKTGVMALPVLVLFGLIEFFNQPATLRPGIKLIAFAALAFVLLAVVPNLPALRESRFITFFEFNPFAEWQKAFSTKSALGWIDRDGIVTRGIDPGYAPTTANGGTYLGLFTIVLFAVALFRDTLHRTELGRQARRFVALALLAFWLSFGPGGVLGGHLAFLNFSRNAPDFAPALGWLFLVIQVWVIFRLIPREWRKAGLIAGIILSVIYLIVPGFRILELLPLYHHIRAPFDFFQVTGFLCVVFAAGILARVLLAEIPVGTKRSGLVAVVLAIALLDVSPYARPLFQSPLSSTLFTDFLAAQAYLKSSTVSGRVYPFSGRYFYLLTPGLSGRGLNTEAFNNYLQQHGAAVLQNAAFISADTLRSYVRIVGISHLLLDKNDPDTPENLQKHLRKLFPTVFENENFAILENKAPLGEAFLAKDFIRAGEQETNLGPSSLGGAEFNLAVITMPSEAKEEPDLRGEIVEGKILLNKDGKNLEGAPFVPVRRRDGIPYSTLTFEPTGAAGWLVLTQAWHPDWAAYGEANVRIPIHQAFAGLSAVRTDGKNPVAFRFQPPSWYAPCIFLGLLAWLGCGVLGILARTPAFKARGPANVQSLYAVMDRKKIARPIVVIPTYNEAEGIVTIMDIALSQLETLHVLVVDDGSPDGTADKVRNHAMFGTRVHLLSRSKKMGLGNAYKAGFKWAEEQGHDAVLEMDADLSHDPVDIPRLVAALDEGADVAVGSRYYKGVRVLNWDESRLMLSLGASKFVRAVTGLPLTDATSGFKALRIEALQKLNWNRFTARGYGFQIELHYFLWKMGCRMVDVPIIFTERREGKTKMTAGIAVEALQRVLKLAVLGK